MAKINQEKEYQNKIIRESLKQEVDSPPSPVNQVCLIVKIFIDFVHIQFLISISLLMYQVRIVTPKSSGQSKGFILSKDMMLAIANG